MQKPKKVIIIGGGASGLVTAYLLSKSLDKQDFILLEKNDRLGKKLSATGNGQCNLSNQSIGKDNYYGNQDVINAFLENFDSNELSNLFYRLGIPLCQDKGKIYPLSKQANAVVDAFRGYFTSCGAEVITNAKVEKIEENNGIFTVLTTNGNKFYAENLVFAVGGKAGKQYGTDGSSYGLIEGLGHTVTPLYPSIVQLKTEKEKIKGLKGHKEYVKVSCIKDGKTLKTAYGDILFTEYGVSGNAIFSISSAVAGNDKCTLKIEFLPDYNKNDIAKILQDKMENNPYIPKEEILSGIINKKIGEALVKVSKEYSANAICQTLKDFTLRVEGSMGFDYAQVTKGGINGKEVNPQTFESKLKKGLFLTGEVLDVDGDCGGYNLTFAFYSAMTVAKEICKKYQK